MSNGKEITRADQVFESFPSLDPPPTTHLEKTGTRILQILLWAICLAVGLFLFCWWCTRPSAESVKAVAEAAADKTEPLTQQQLIEYLTTARREHTESLKDFFQLLVLSALIPLFTLIAGYLFGKGELGGKAPPGDDDGNG